MGRVQCYDSAGQPIWISIWLDTGQVAWNGIASQGEATGQPVPPGTYTWRMKFSLPDSSEGRTSARSLVLQ